MVQIITKDNAKIGIPTSIIILLFGVIMSNGGEYSITNPIDDVKDNSDDLEEILHQQSVMKKKLNKITNAICNHPEFTCVDR